MEGVGGQPMKFELRELVLEASIALARLDADRLEELAYSCRALNGNLAESGMDRRAELRSQAREASRAMAVLGRVLEGTRANLDIVHRLAGGERGGLEYAATGRTGAFDGNN